MKTKPKGVKFDSGKSRVDLIPADVLLSVGDVLGYGAGKYGELNWTKGIVFSRLIGAASRHLLLFKSGQNFDKESLLHHLDHSITNLIMLKHLYNINQDLDDRWEKYDATEGTKRARVFKSRKSKAKVRKQKTNKVSNKSKQGNQKVRSRSGRS